TTMPTSTRRSKRPFWGRNGTLHVTARPRPTPRPKPPLDVSRSLEWLGLPAGRVGLAEPVAQVGGFHVLNHGAGLEEERHLTEAPRVERAVNQFLPLEGGAQVVHAVGDVRPVPQLPQPDLLGRHVRPLPGAEVFQALRVGARVGDPHLTERHPALAGLRL